MTWDIHSFMKKPRNSYFVFYNPVQHEVMFYGKAAAAGIPIITRFTQLWIDGELLQSTIQLGGIHVHLPLSPLFTCDASRTMSDGYCRSGVLPVVVEARMNNAG